VGSVIGDIRPVALGVAISPIPVIAVSLMLFAPQARAASVALMVGGFLGTAVALPGVRQWGARPTAGAEAALLSGANPKNLQQPLDDVREWLTLPKAAVMPVLMPVIDLDILGKALAGL
jgi:hypothetical protein